MPPIRRADVCYRLKNRSSANAAIALANAAAGSEESTDDELGVGLVAPSPIRQYAAQVLRSHQHRTPQQQQKPAASTGDGEGDDEDGGGGGGGDAATEEKRASQDVLDILQATQESHATEAAAAEEEASAANKKQRTEPQSTAPAPPPPPPPPPAALNWKVVSKSALHLLSTSGGGGSPSGNGTSNTFIPAAVSGAVEYEGSTARTSAFTFFFLKYCTHQHNTAGSVLVMCSVWAGMNNTYCDVRR